MNETEEFDGYLESLPTMLTLLSEAVHPSLVATTPGIQELRAALGAALAAAERLRHERRRAARRGHGKDLFPNLHLVTCDGG